MGFALKSSTWEVQGTGCSVTLSLMPRSLTWGQRNLCVSPAHQGGSAPPRSPPAHPCHSNKKPPQRRGPCPEQRAAWDCRGTWSGASTDECKCLHPLGATSPVTTQTSIVSGRHRSYASPQECPVSPSYGNAWGARANLPCHPQLRSQEEAHAQLPCTHALLPKLNLPWYFHVPCHPQSLHPCRLIS